MLRGIHKATSTWIGKAVMGTIMGGLIISFAIWGIGDIFRGFGANSVAKIGGTEISIEQFRQYYSDQLQRLSRQAGRPITSDQARAIGLDRQLIGQLVAETTLDEQARKLRLGLSNEDIAQRIVTDQNFLGANGQFDRARFEQIIRQAGFTETRYVNEQRNVLLRRQIAQSISGDLRVPTSMLTAINQFQNEKRTIEYIALTAAQAGDIPAPTPEQLGKYFDERKVLFRAPEYRKVTLLSLTPADIAKPETITDEEAKAFFDKNQSSFGTPEKRELHQMAFPTAEEAAAAAVKLSKGMSWTDLVKERNLKESDLDLGVVTKADIIDPAVADAAFALKSGETSAPVKGAFGSVILQVGKIEPGSQKTFAEVAGEIKNGIAEQRAKTELSALRDKIEDERAAGSTLAETAKKLNLKSVTYDAVDRAGRGTNGGQIPNLPKTPDVINAAFTTDVGVDTDALQLPGGGFLWYDVTGITRSRDRPLDEVKELVEQRWRDDEAAARLQKKADDMVAKLKAGATLADVAKEIGFTVGSTAGIQRGKPTPQTPAKLIDAVFKTPKGAASATDGDSQTQRFVFRVIDVVDPTLDEASPETKQLTSTLQNSYADDIIGEYIGQLEAEYGVKINQQALSQVVGGGTPAQ
jgi:peptidyl-prolyl cis-trans isomerase D